MITIFNRKEVYHGFSMEDFGRIRGILQDNQIKYTYKVLNPNNRGIFDAGHSNGGTLGLNLKYAYEYYLYVHKDDYEKSCYIINHTRY
ncbi:hypothetical protein [Sinanaerobacter chloroacetimidivorans]|jgi:hypothetical protein|uniref:Uncharacterized protein n=1 Tax=Sinanaerobacter chloroacetimidivorans TaxID=2818044 RepID=A0A8J8B335_9FIRM|nr:hypothetical protein [Sinanaerobacter chloroacetimidivorans]MBR0599964.1 hypothetical protein [Sinanaerobacter chloroacetimidivorans]